jgi:hypothetical protein
MKCGLIETRQMSAFLLWVINRSTHRLPSITTQYVRPALRPGHCELLSRFCSLSNDAAAWRTMRLVPRCPKRVNQNRPEWSVSTVCYGSSSSNFFCLVLIARKKYPLLTSHRSAQEVRELCCTRLDGVGRRQRCCPEFRLAIRSNGAVDRSAQGARHSRLLRQLSDRCEVRRHR